MTDRPPRPHLGAMPRRAKNLRAKANNIIRRKHKREEAEQRQATYERLTTASKLACAQVRRGESKREIERLT